ARVAVLVAKPLENPLRGMPLLPRPALIRRQDTVDDPGERVKIRARRRSAPPIPGRYGKRQHLGYCPRINAKLPRRFPTAQTLDLYRVTNPPIGVAARFVQNCTLRDSVHRRTGPPFRREGGG